MFTEVASYRLSYRERPIGSQILRTTVDRKHIRLETKTQLQGNLGSYTIEQKSRVFKPNLNSQYYFELTENRNKKSQFEVTFDYKSGLMTAKVGRHDSSSQAYFRDYSDPLGMLYVLRQRCAESKVHIPMLGKDIVAEYIGEYEVETSTGSKNARAFVLQPGGSYVYIDSEAPHHVVKLTQRLDAALVDAVLVKVEKEAYKGSKSKQGNRKNRSSRRSRRRRAKTS